MARAGYEIAYDAVRVDLNSRDLERLLEEKWLLIKLDMIGGASSARICFVPPDPDFTDYELSG